MPISWYFSFGPQYSDVQFQCLQIVHSFTKPGMIPTEHSLYHWADNCMHFHIESNFTWYCRKRVLNFDTSRIESARRLHSFLSPFGTQI